MRAHERRLAWLAYVGGLAVLLLPGGALVVGAIWLYRYLRMPAVLTAQHDERIQRGDAPPLG